MNLHLQAFKEIPRLLNMPKPDVVQQESRIRFTEIHIVLPVKALIVGLLFYYLLFAQWLNDFGLRGEMLFYSEDSKWLWEGVRWFFLGYVVANGVIAWLLLARRGIPVSRLERITFTTAWIDVVFLAVLTLATGGFESILFWGFLVLVVRNAASNPVPMRQLALNGIVLGSFLMAGLLDLLLRSRQLQTLDDLEVATAVAEYSAPEPAALRLVLLALLSACCYGVQVYFDRIRVAEVEAREFSARQQQLQAQGRLAAEIAHQLKNPLGIINNAAFTLQRTVKEGKTITQQIQMIREEVDRSDRIITELMGYARLAEGKVEKLNVAEELDSALDRVFPVAAKYEVVIERDYAPALPALLVQRSHLSEVFVNILQNAREAMSGTGRIRVTTRYGQDYSVIIVIEDNGPGIPAEKMSMIFEPYFTTKERGTGLGLAIVKHNTEIYGGTVEVESELGIGTRFTIHWPAKSVMRIRQ